MTRVLLAEKEKSGEILDFFFAKFRPQWKGRMKGGENREFESTDETERPPRLPGDNAL